MKMKDYGYEDLDKIEHEMYADFKKLVHKMDDKFRFDDSTAIYFVLDDVLYGYDEVTYLNQTYSVVWNEIREYEIDDDGALSFEDEAKQMFLLEYEDVVELYSILDMELKLKRKK